jgi:DNA-binding MarR family transcriptional regulator
MPRGDAPTKFPRGVEDAITDPLEHTIDPENFTPRLLALLSNALVWRESHELRRRFGLGTNDWRVISAVALRPGCSSTEASEFIAVNKAVVSKSVTTLVERELIVLVDGPRGSRRMYLTPAGARMHDEMLPVSVSGQDIIHSEIAPEQIATLNSWLRDMIDRVREAQPDAASEAAVATTAV